MTDQSTVGIHMNAYTPDAEEPAKLRHGVCEFLEGISKELCKMASDNGFDTLAVLFDMARERCQAHSCQLRRPFRSSLTRGRAAPVRPRYLTSDFQPTVLSHHLAAHQARLRGSGIHALAHQSAAQRTDAVDHVKRQAAKTLRRDEIGQQAAV